MKTLRPTSDLLNRNLGPPPQGIQGHVKVGKGLDPHIVFLLLEMPSPQPPLTFLANSYLYITSSRKHSLLPYSGLSAQSMHSLSPFVCLSFTCHRCLVGFPNSNEKGLSYVSRGRSVNVVELMNEWMDQ